MLEQLSHGCDSIGAAGIWVVLSNNIRGTLVSVDAVKGLLIGPVGAAAVLAQRGKELTNTNNFTISFCLVNLIIVLFWWYLMRDGPAFGQNISHTYVHKYIMYYLHN